jgi:hypothetical protein
MGLDPIPDLFTKETLSPHGIDPDKINSWFLPLYADHCNTMNRNPLSKSKLDCEQKLGCGYSDNCTFGQICKDGGEKGEFECSE